MVGGGAAGGKNEKLIFLGKDEKEKRKKGENCTQNVIKALKMHLFGLHTLRPASI